MLKRLISVVLSMLIIIMLIPKVSFAAGNCYYVDSQMGNDLNDGLSPLTPWKSLNMINNRTFLPGESIFLKSGSEWSDTCLKLRGSGVDKNPIKVDMYGGDVRPIINTNGIFSEAVSIKYNAYWEVNNLELTNYTQTAGTYRRGIYVESGSAYELNHIYIRNVYVHDVDGVLTDRHNGGIIFRAYSETTEVTYNDILIENCTVVNVDRDGIRFNSQTSRNSRNVVIRNNFVDNIGGDGIVAIGTQNALIENNTAKDCNKRGDKACVAIWSYGSDNTIVQNNEAYLTRNTKDGQGFDSDYNSSGAIFQYNYSHDNEGGFMLICNNPTPATNYNTGTIVRYNISQNDKSRGIMLSGNPSNTQIYNNTIYIGSSMNTSPVSSWDWNGGWADNTRFTNNIFYNLGSGDYNFGQTTNNLFEYNTFYGNHPANEPTDVYKSTSDPKFVNPGGASIGIQTAVAYKLSYNSPCIDSGTLVSNNGGKDFFGNNLSDGKTDRGAHENQKKNEIVYDSVLYELNLNNCDDFTDTGLIGSDGVWSIGIGSENKKCLIGRDAVNNKITLVMGNDNWTDYTVEMKFKMVLNDDISDTLGVTLYTRSGDTLGTGNFFKYVFRDPVYYGNYFGGYAKDGSSNLGIIDNNWVSGNNSNARIKRNAMQSIKADISNVYGTNGAIVKHTVTLNEGASDEYITAKSKWYESNSGLLNGKAGIEFLSVGKLATFEVYSLKITGKRTTNINYYNDNGEKIEVIPQSGSVTVSGDFGMYKVSEDTDFIKPTVITCLYDGNTLVDKKIFGIADNEYDAVINKIFNVEPGYQIKTYLWQGLNSLNPLAEPFVLK